MKKWLVTGGCGFIGSHLADTLIAGGDHVRILDDLSSGKRENAPAGAEFVHGDVSVPTTVTSAMQGVSGCFHLAAIASVERCNDDWHVAHRVNVGGLINVLDAARPNATPVVYASSAAVYGGSGDVPLSESSITDPLSFYGVDKLSCELQARVAARQFGVPSAGLRLFNVYGARQAPETPYSGVISIFTGRMVRGQAIVLHGDGQQTRDFVHVRDVVRSFVAAMPVADPGACVFNVCTGRGTSLLHLVASLETVVGRKAKIEWQKRRAGDVEASLGDPSRIANRIGWLASVDLEQGLSELAAALAP